VSDNLTYNETLIAGEDGNSSMVSSAGRSTKISTRGSSTSVSRERVSSCNGTNSAATSDSDSSKMLSLKMTEGSGSNSTFAVKGSVIGSLSGSGSYSTLGSLQSGSDE